MKTILTTLLLLCLIATQSFSQWDWLNPRPHGNANNRIAFGNSSNDYTIVGKAGIIMKTTNDGVNWEIQNSGTAVNLNDVHISGNNAITVGNGGTVLGTTNGGTTWTAINSGTTTNLTAVTFATSAIGIITGWNGLILRTVNSGGSWTTVALPTTQRLYGVSFADANNGIAVGDGGVILKTTNGGADWNSLTSGTIQSLYDVSYVNSSTAVASGFNGTVIRTTNGGTTWNPIGLFTGTQWGVSFTDPDNGVVVGDGSVIARTTNGGINWANIFPPGGSFSNFYSVRFYNSTQGVVVGEWGGIFKTNDGGLTWEIVTKGIVNNQAPSGFVARNSFFEVQCINPSSAVILRSNGIYLTSDNAQTWNLSSISGNILLNGMHFMDMSTGTVVGTSSGSDVIMKTTNAGTDWVTQHSSTSGKLNAVSFGSINNGIVVGAGGRILGTTNGGQDWISPTIPPEGFDLYDVQLVTSSVGYAVGRYGRIYKTTDGGASWDKKFSNNFYNFYGVAFIDEAKGFAVGDSIRIGVSYGLILKTVDGGSTWSKQVLDSPLSFNDVTFTDNSNWYAVGTSVTTQPTSIIGRIFKSTNAGISWFEQQIPFKSTRFIEGISAFDNDNLIAVGWDGMVLGTTNGGGTTSVEEDIVGYIPEEFFLQQNYPNPFNPSTTISWQSPTGSHQTLNIYDVLGNEVATLVDEYLPVGSFKVEFNAEGLSSGIYFYKLQAGSFVETKKMVLLK